jgi:NADP-dependent 3-hydroxy acid dehydrogenase YdfG
MSGEIDRWAGRVALVTGASSGIGRAIALDLLDAGMNVAAWARRVERLQDLPGALAQRVDLRDEAQILAGFARIREEWGGVDVLVNNAGLGRSAPLLSGASDDWREMLDVNVLGLCICTREAIHDMRARGDDGHVIHISSMAGHRVPKGSGVYAASKHAVRALTEGLRVELHEAGSGVRVTAISPGYVETEFAAVYSRSEEAAASTYGRFKVLEAVDVASAVRHVLAAPAHVQYHDVLMRPTEQPT